MLLLLILEDLRFFSVVDFGQLVLFYNPPSINFLFLYISLNI